MRPLRTDAEFLALASRAGSAALARACISGTFTPPTPRTFPWGTQGWSFAVMNDRGSKWVITIEVLEAERKYRTKVRKI